MHRGLPATFMVTALTGLLVFTFAFPPSVKPDTSHLIITQVQIASTTGANDEFVEIYNPTEADQNLTDLRLTRTNSTGTTVQNLIASMSGVLASHHYLLVAHPAYTTISPAPDKVYSASSSGITTNSTIILYDTNHVTVIDKVGFGTAQNFETSPAPNPPSGQSLVRTNFTDTDNNLVDFAISTSPIIHNSTFINEEPTDTSTPTPSPEPTSVPEITPTVEPTPTLEPTPTNQVTPTETPEPTIKPQPSVYPSSTPASTPTPTHHQDKKPKHQIKEFIESCRHYIEKFHWPHFSFHSESPNRHR